MTHRTLLVVAGTVLLALSPVGPGAGAGAAAAAEAGGGAGGEGGPARNAILAMLAAQALAADPAFSGFSAERGGALFAGRFSGGSPELPSCTTCHSPDPRQFGQTRAGKEIEPMAVAVTPARFTDTEKVEKWFGRNCQGVLGRSCTPTEKGDFITFMIHR